MIMFGKEELRRNVNVADGYMALAEKYENEARKYYNGVTRQEKEQKDKNLLQASKFYTVAKEKYFNILQPLKENPCELDSVSKDLIKCCKKNYRTCRERADAINRNLIVRVLVWLWIQ